MADGSVFCSGPQTELADTAPWFWHFLCLRAEDPAMLRVMIPSLTTGNQPDHRLATTAKGATASVSSGQPLRPSHVPADWHFKPKDGEAFWVWVRAVHCNEAMESPEAESQARRGCYVPFSFSGFHMSMTRESAEVPWWAIYDVLLVFETSLSVTLSGFVAQLKWDRPTSDLMESDQSILSGPQRISTNRSAERHHSAYHGLAHNLASRL